MKAALSKKSAPPMDDAMVWHYFGGVKVSGVPKGICGDLSGICGNLSDITGDLSGVRGDLTDIWGDLSGVRGNLSGITGNLDDCEISEEDRRKGIKVRELVSP